MKLDHGSDGDKPVAKDSAPQAKPSSPKDPKAVPASESFTKDSKPQAKPASRAFDMKIDTELDKHPSSGGEVDKGKHEEMRASKHSDLNKIVEAKKYSTSSDKC